MKYKHKNTGIVGEVQEGWLYLERCSGEVCSQESISMTFIENSSDWELVEEEKLYEILEYIYDYNGTKTTFTKKEDIWQSGYGYRNYTEVEVKSYASQGKSKISKVKRLSDGLVISIGDKFEGDLDKAEVVESIVIDKSWYKGLRIGNKVAGVSIDSYIPYKEPIYVTADGYEFKSFGEKVHWILDTNDGEETKYLYSLELCKSHLHILGEGHNYKVFYSEEKAQAFVDSKNEERLLDSKVLSYNEVMKVIDSTNLWYELNIKLKELVKSKQ